MAIKKTWNRRELVRLAAYSGLGLSGVEQLLQAVPGWAGRTESWALDTFEVLRRRPYHAGFQLLAPSVALAEDSKGVAVVVIKIMNLIHTPLAFKFPTYTGSASYGKGWNSRFATAAVRDALLAKGLDEVSDLPRFAALKLNRWFAQILNTGMDETATAMPFLDEGEIATFPDESDVALQAALHLNQNNTSLNHSFQNTTLLKADEGKGGDINFHLAQNGIVRSPLGITALNMGNAVETTDAIGTVGNRVVGSDLLKVIADGKAVENYVNLLSQSIGVGYIDDDLVQKFDKKTSADTAVREAMRSSRPELEKAIKLLRDTAAVETAQHTMGGLANMANVQGKVTGAAQCEFLAQCLFVRRVLDIPGRPLRNFSLMVNINDIDGGKLDQPGAEGVRASLSYVEAMRQLAMGMNVLAQAIKKHKNLYVLVITEGGRGFNGGDNKVGSAFIMAPGGKDGLKDYLYANKASVDDANDSFCAEPNEGNANAGNSPGLTTAGAGLRELSDGVLRKEDGGELKGFTNTAALLHGVVRHLEDVTGVKGTTKGLGPYIQIKAG